MAAVEHDPQKETDGMIRLAIGERRFPVGLLALFVGLVACAQGPGGEGGSDAADAADRESTPAAAPVAAETVPVMAADALLALLESDDGPLVLDVRTPEEYRQGHVPGAINIPHDQIDGQVGILDPYRERGVVVYCRTGRRAGIAEEALRVAGFERVWDLDGHMVSWMEAGHPLDVAADCC